MGVFFFERVFRTGHSFSLLRVVTGRTSAPRSLVTLVGHAGRRGARPCFFPTVLNTNF